MMDETSEREPVAAQAYEREAQFERLLSTAERKRDVPPEQVTADVADVVAAVRGGT